MVTHCSQTHRGNAAALPAIRIPAKLAGSDPRPEVSRDDFCGSCKYAFPRIHGRTCKFPNDRFRHFQPGILQPQPSQIGNLRTSFRRRQYFRVGGSTLRSKNTEPYLCNLRLVRPEMEELVEVTRAPRYLRRNRAMNGHARPLDVPEDAFVGSRCTPRVVFRLQAIDGYDYIQLPEFLPGGWDWPEGAGDDLCMYTAAFNVWQQQLEFTITNQRVAPYQ